MTGVDTNFETQQNFSGPGTSAAAERVTQTDKDLQTTIMFGPLEMNDDGIYECLATVISTSQHPYVIASDAIVNDIMISITRKLSRAAMYFLLISTF